MNDAHVKSAEGEILRPLGLRPFRAGGLWAPPEPRYDLILDRLKDFPQCELEVGAGQGWHAIQRARQNPQTLIVAIERTRAKFDSFWARHLSHQLHNLIPVHCDAVPWLVHLPTPLQFSKIWILYPNPEVGRPNLRWIRMSFFEVLLKRLSKTGELIFATNLSAYAEELMAYAVGWGLSSESQAIKGPPRTHFEKKYMERGESCLQITLRRRTRDV